VKSKDGALPDLLNALTCDYYHFRYDQSAPKDAVVRAARPVVLSPQQRIPLGELLATVPAVGELASQQYGNWPYSPTAVRDVVLQQLGAGGNYRVVVMPGQHSDQAAWDRLQGERYERRGDVGVTPFAEIISPEAQTPGDLPLTSLFRDVAAGGYWYVYDRNPYLLMPRIATFVTIGFAFGFLARYRPVQWSSLIAGVESPAVHVIRRFLSLAFDEFPLLALRELSDIHYALGPTYAQMME